MKKGSIYAYFMKEKIGMMIVALGFYFGISILLNVLMGKDIHGSVTAMSIIIIFMSSSRNQDVTFQKFSCLSASRKELFRIQLISDLCLSLVMGVGFMAFSFLAELDLGSFWFLQVVRPEHGFTGFFGIEFGVIYFSIVICISAIITLDAFRKEPLFEGMFSSKKMKHPFLGFGAYMAIAIGSAVLFELLEDQEALWIRESIYGVLLLATVAIYMGARRLSTKKEF